MLIKVDFPLAPVPYRIKKTCSDTSQIADAFNKLDVAITDTKQGLQRVPYLPLVPVAPMHS